MKNEPDRNIFISLIEIIGSVGDKRLKANKKKNRSREDDV